MILTNATLITLWETTPFVEGALVAVEGKTIVDFDKVGKLVDRYDDEETFDVGGRVVVPGLINGHTHLRGSLARGMPTPTDSTGDGRYPVDCRWRIDGALGGEDIYLSATIGLLDSVRAGVTTVFDHHSSPGQVDGSLELVRRAFDDVGVRGVIGYMISDRHGESVARAAVDENRRFVETCRSEKTDMMRGVFGLDASYRLSKQTIMRAVEAAGALDAGVHVPVAEHASDVEATRALYDASPIQRLATEGVLNQRSIAVHGAHLEDGDYDELQRSGATLVLTTQAAAARGGAVPDLHRLTSSGIPTGMGTDGLTPSLLDELWATALVKQPSDQPPETTAREAFHVAFRGNAEMASSLFGTYLGRIRPGGRADLVVLDAQLATPLEPRNLIDHVLWGLSRAPVRMVVINGRVVFRDGTFPHLDEPRLRARAREAAEKLWDRA